MVAREQWWERESTGQGPRLPDVRGRAPRRRPRRSVHERGGHDTRPDHVGVLAHTQHLRVRGYLPVSEMPLGRLDVGQPHQPRRRPRGGVAGVDGSHHQLGERWRMSVAAGSKGGGRGTLPPV
jgi:hypothetical protein